MLYHQQNLIKQIMLKNMEYNDSKLKTRFYTFRFNEEVFRNKQIWIRGKLFQANYNKVRFPLYLFFFISVRVECFFQLISVMFIHISIDSNSSKLHSTEVHSLLIFHSTIILKLTFHFRKFQKQVKTGKTV